MNYLHEFLLSTIGLEYLFYGFSGFILLIMICMCISNRNEKKKRFNPAIYKLILQTRDDTTNGYGVPSHGYRFDPQQIDQLLRSQK